MPNPPRQKLRAVSPDEEPPRVTAKEVTPKSVTAAAESGNAKELLLALRARVAKAVEDPNCPPRDLAALSRRLQDIGRDIEAIEAREKQEAAEDVDGHPDEAWDSEAL